MSRKEMITSVTSPNTSNSRNDAKNSFQERIVYAINFRYYEQWHLHSFLFYCETLCIFDHLECKKMLLLLAPKNLAN